MTITDIFLYFILFSFVGWAYECLLSIVRDHKVVNRGFLNGPYCPIYGAGALLFLAISNLIKNPVAIFFIGGTVACILEYLTSYIMEKVFKARWWSYEKYPFNLNGRICLYGFMLFGASAVLTLYISEPALDIISRIQYRNQLAIILAVLLTLDLYTTNKSIAKFNKLLREYQETYKTGKIIQIIQRGKKRFEAAFIDKPRKVLTYQQRRILKAFPNFESHYNLALKEIKKFYKNTRQKPDKRNAYARKKSKKILK